MGNAKRLVFCGRETLGHARRSYGVLIQAPARRSTAASRGAHLASNLRVFARTSKNSILGIRSACWPYSATAANGLAHRGPEAALAGIPPTAPSRRANRVPRHAKMPSHRERSRRTVGALSSQNPALAASTNSKPRDADEKNRCTLSFRVHPLTAAVGWPRLGLAC